MSENDDLDPALVRRLRDVPPASESLRDAHIAAALAEMAPGRRSSIRGIRVLSGVAAAVVLAVGGVAIARQQRDSSRGTLNGVVETTIPKGGADCADEFSDLWGEVGASKEIARNGKAYAVMFRDDNIDIYQATEPCNLVGTMEYREALVARDNKSLSPPTTAFCSYTTEPVRQFSDSARGDDYRLVLIETDNGLSLHFEDRCNDPIATIDLP